MISLEPVTKRGKVRPRVKSNSADRFEENSSRGSRHNDELAPAEGSSENKPPLSPSPSEVSSVSAVTASTQSYRIVQRPSSANGTSINYSENRNSGTSTSTEQTINANIELLKPGALPGETVQLRVSVNHIKRVRGTIIVTLYRLGRVDMHPPIPVATKGKTKQEYEDIYPRSKTGLGGLHFSTGSANSQFRKDLTQSFTPMIVNPQNLTADVKANIRVPEDVFPTMDNLPGNMILFKYYVEVVIDVCGKLGESRILPRFNMTSNPANYAPDRFPYEGSDLLTTPTTDRVIDTEPMRRNKGVVHCRFELVVGSRDTGKTMRKGPQISQAETARHVTNNSESVHSNSNGPSHDDYYDNGADGYDGYEGWNHEYVRDWHDYYPPPDHSVQQPTAEQLFPPPIVQSDGALDEKARLRRKEEMLLPSRPPADGEPGPSNSDANTPSAPFIGDFHEASSLHDQGHGLGRTRAYDDNELTVPSNCSVDTVVRAPVNPGVPPPAFETGSTSAPQEDKQEMERQRLLALASAPPTDEAQASRSTENAQNVTPSAPVLTEEDEYQAHTLNDDSQLGDHLPEYRR